MVAMMAVITAILPAKLSPLPWACSVTCSRCCSCGLGTSNSSAIRVLFDFWIEIMVMSVFRLSAIFQRVGCATIDIMHDLACKLTYFLQRSHILCLPLHPRQVC